MVLRGPLNGLLGRLGDLLALLQTIEVPLGTLLCCLGAISGAHPTVLDAGKTQKADMLKMYVFLKDWDDLLFFGALLTAS